jgi:hypothetical protein
MDIWAIGNGESRRNFNLNQIKGYTIGCNAIHRNYICNIFVAVDRKMVREIMENPACSKKIIYTRPEWYKEFNSTQILSLPEIPYKDKHKQDIGLHWNSGPYAILLACLRHPKKVNLLGFDLYGVNGLQNNIYKDTANYAPSNQKEIKPTFWIHQLGKLFEIFSHIEFCQHQMHNWQIPTKWSIHMNLTVKYFSV